MNDKQALRKSEYVPVRIPPPMIDALDELQAAANTEGLDRSKLMRALLKVGMHVASTSGVLDVNGQIIKLNVGERNG